MVYLYIDESGDLGFSGRGSKYFVITCVKIDDDRTNVLFKRIPKEVRSRKLPKKTKKQSELKFSNSSIAIREFFSFKSCKVECQYFFAYNKKSANNPKIKRKFANTLRTPWQV